MLRKSRSYPSHRQHQGWVGAEAGGAAVEDDKEWNNVPPLLTVERYRSLKKHIYGGVVPVLGATTYPLESGTDHCPKQTHFLGRTIGSVVCFLTIHRTPV